MEDMIKKVSEKKLGVTNKASETVKGREERSDVVITRKPVVSTSASSDLSKPNPSEDPDIVEVPVPPKPPAPVITLDMEDDNGEGKEKEGSPSLPISDLGCSNETAPTPAGPGANHHSTSNELPVRMTELLRGSNETTPTLAGPGANDHSTSDDLPVWMTELLRGSAVSLSIAKTTEADVGERAEKEASANSQKPQDKFQVLKVLSERENDLYKELDEMEARRREIRETLEYLRNLRNETIASGLAKTD